MYYKITILQSDDKAQVGDFYLSGMKPTHLGGTPSCDIPISIFGDFEPEVLATILPRADKSGWMIVRRSDHFETFVNDRPLLVCLPLQDGDVIRFRKHEKDPANTAETSESLLSFSIQKDGEYSAAMGGVHRKAHSNRKLTLLSIASLLVAVCLFSLVWFSKGEDNLLRHENLDAYDASIYHITVDSVYLQKDTLVNGELQTKTLEAIALDHEVSGTCFLTSDSLFVTARHCVEPWISDEDWNGISIDKTMSPALRLSTLAETYNHQLGENIYSVKAHCVITKQMEQYEYESSDFVINRTRDQVVCLGTNQHPLYWRTIMPLASKRDMELGDFAYVHAPGLKGNLELASYDDLRKFDKQPDKDIAVIGFPVNDNQSEEVCVKVFGNSQHIEFTPDDKGITGCIQMSAPINPGNSGGPILARIGKDTKVIGIVSKADGKASQGTLWAVPSTEILHMKQQGVNKEDAAEETTLFRR